MVLNLQNPRNLRGNAFPPERKPPNDAKGVQLRGRRTSVRLETLGEKAKIHPEPGYLLRKRRALSPPAGANHVTKHAFSVSPESIGPSSYGRKFNWSNPQLLQASNASIPQRDQRDPSPSDHQKRMLDDDKLYRCDVVGCGVNAAGKDFATFHDFMRHKKAFHRTSEEKVVCRCSSGQCRNSGKIWPRLDNFKQHIARMHKGEDEQDIIRKSVYRDLSSVDNDNAWSVVTLPRGSSSQRFPALETPQLPPHDGSVSSSSLRQLPSPPHNRKGLAEIVAGRQETNRVHSTPHRQLISPTNQLPTTIKQQFYIGSLPPKSVFVPSSSPSTASTLHGSPYPKPVNPYSKMSQRRAIACTICAMAKVKCDKAVPSCSRCIAKGLQCEPRSTRRISNNSADFETWDRSNPHSPAHASGSDNSGKPRDIFGYSSLSSSTTPLSKSHTVSRSQQDSRSVFIDIASNQSSLVNPDPPRRRQLFGAPRTKAEQQGEALPKTSYKVESSCFYKHYTISQDTTARTDSTATARLTAVEDRKPFLRCTKRSVHVLSAKIIS